MDRIKKLTTTLNDNKDVIRRKVLILAGTAVGIIIAGALLNKLTEDERTIVVEETTVVSDED